MSGEGGAGDARPEAPAARRRAMLSLVVGKLARRDPARRRGGPVRRWLLTRLGRDPGRGDMAARCHQCAGWSSVSVVRLGAREARYWCLRCGAVVTVRDLSVLTPVSRLRTAPPASGPAGPDAGVAGPSDGAAGRGPAGAGGRTSDGAGGGTPVGAGGRTPGGAAELGEVMPPAMRRWVRAGSRRPVRRLDKSTIYQLYRSWDAHLGRIGRQAASELAGDGEPAPLPGLPAFSMVVGALHDACYHTDLVVRWLLESTGAPTELATGPLRERVEHARRWLARHGRQLCWIHSRVPVDGPAVPERRLVDVAAAALRSGERPDPEPGRAARAALFGTDGGPALPALLRIYPPDRMLAGLRTYLASGDRPLREDVLARLAAPPDR